MKHQAVFIDRLEKSLPNGQSLAPILSDLLDISMDSAYRRINGKTSFSLEESLLIAENFNISLDGLKNPDQMNASFSFSSLGESLESFKGYLKSLLASLEMIKNAPDGQLYYSCLDIPIFQNLSLSNISAFKMFYWMHSIMEVEELKGKTFEPSIIPSKLIDLGKKVYDAYCSIPTKELWTTNTINSTLRQIEFCNNSGFIKSREVKELIYQDLDELLNRLSRKAEEGTKVIDRIPESFEKGNFELYESDIELSSNGALAVVNGRKISFIGHMTFNTLVSDHAELNAKTLIWYERLVRKANLISNVSAKHRYQYISTLRIILEESRKRVLA